jgi:serine-type D-Ala-D-Ala carboxypeptidase (penicillin-binding protein 5/6)
METAELQKIAEHSRTQREAGIALLVASVFLGIFLFIPLAFRQAPAAAPVAVATSTVPNAFAGVLLEAEAAIVYDVVTGKVLYEKNADAQLPLASLTKLLTVYAAFSELPADSLITIPEDVAQLEAPRAFNVGQTFTLTDLAELTLTASLNDGAAAIAHATAERTSRSQTDMLAGAASALGLSQTFAINGSGLDVNTAISGAYGSARDLSRLAGAFVEKMPKIAAATTKLFAEAVSAGGTHFKVKNTDPFVDTIAGLLLSKTGFTDLAGGNLALVFDAAMGHPIAVVVLGSTEKDRFTDGIALVNATFAHFAQQP